MMMDPPAPLGPLGPPAQWRQMRARAYGGGNCGQASHHPTGALTLVSLCTSGWRCGRFERRAQTHRLFVQLHQLPLLIRAHVAYRLHWKQSISITRTQALRLV
jgi:hypothetical protein